MASASASASEEQPLLINTDIKSDLAFQTQLANMAYADLLHDFGHAGFKLDENTKKIFDKGLPVMPNNKWDEDKTFQSVLQNLNTSEVNETAPTMFSVGYANKPIHNYLAKSYKIPDDDKADPDFGANFVNKMELGGIGQSAAFIVDFNQHGFLEKLKRGKSADGFEIFYLMTPEVVNDPAGKSNVYGDALFGANNANSGVKMISYVSETKEHTHYLKFEPDYQSTNMFFSNYNFRLSPIQSLITKQKVKKLVVSLNVSQPERPNLVANIEDSKGENSINTIIGYLKKIVKSLFGKSTSSAEFNFNTKIQQKRGGDWFQALSCLDARNRIYTEALPNPGTGRKLPDTCPIYFVSHDRIAVAYALLIGANVIYLDYYKKVFVFKNNADATVKPSDKPIHQIILDNIKNKWISSGSLDILIQTGEGYNLIKNSIVDFAFSNYENKCKEFTAALNALSMSVGAYQDTVKKGLISVCVEAVRYAFIKSTLIDISAELDLLKTFDANNKANTFDTSNKDAILSLNSAINTVNSIQEKFGIMARQDATMQSGIDWWIASNVLKMDVYKSAAHIFDGLGTEDIDFAAAAKRLEDRLITIVDENERKPDKHIFLAFLQHSLVDADKIPFQQMISVLINKTKEYFTLVSPDEAVHLLRGKRIAPTVLFYNLVANLIYEINVIIGTEPNMPSIDVDDILILEASDDALLLADIKDIELLLGDGKNSNDTSYAKDLVLSGGGGDYKIYNAKEKQPSGLINDMGNRQIVWPLLANTMLETLRDLNELVSASDASESASEPASSDASEPASEPASESAASIKGGFYKSSISHAVPSYMIASAALTTHDEAKLARSPDKDNYFAYYGFINSLLQSKQHPFEKHLYVFFFTSNASNLILSELKTYCPIWLLLLNDIYTNVFMGHVSLTPIEEQRHRDLIAEPAFKQFIQDILADSTPIDNVLLVYQAMRSLVGKQNEIKSRSSSIRRSSSSSRKSKSKWLKKMKTKKSSKYPGNKQTRRVKQ